MQIQNFKLHFPFLNRPQYSRFLKLRPLFQEEGGGGSTRQGISISLSMPTYFRASAWLYLKQREEQLSALQRGVRPSPLSKAHTSPLLLPAQRRLRRRGANIPVAKGPSWTELAITPLPQLAPCPWNQLPGKAGPQQGAVLRPDTGSAENLSERARASHGPLEARTAQRQEERCLWLLPPAESPTGPPKGRCSTQLLLLGRSGLETAPHRPQFKTILHRTPSFSMGCTVSHRICSTKHSSDYI